MNTSKTENQSDWFAYLLAHQDERTRNLHYAGTLLGIGMFISALITMQPILFMVGLISAYGLAWAGHFTIEHNQPAAFKKPILSFIYNFKMLWLWLNAEIEGEFTKAVNASLQNKTAETAPVTSNI